MSGTGYAAAVDRLIAALGRMPGIGAKSAERLAHHLLKCPAEEAIELAEAIRAGARKVDRVAALAPPSSKSDTARSVST